jgi:hypothetical protein
MDGFVSWRISESMSASFSWIWARKYSFLLKTSIGEEREGNKKSVKNLGVNSARGLKRGSCVTIEEQVTSLFGSEGRQERTNSHRVSGLCAEVDDIREAKVLALVAAILVE